MNAFDTQKYIKLQSQKILERTELFPKLYLEFGGKLFDEHHFSRCMPGFVPDTKIKMLANIRDRVEVIISILAIDIESGKTRHDVGLSYEDYVMFLVDSFKEVGLRVNSVVVNKFADQPSVLVFKRKLEQLGIIVHLFRKIEGYPSNIDVILSDKGYGANPFIKTEAPIVVVTGPGAGSGKMGVCLSQVYNEHKHGNKNAGYAKFETIPVWNLPLKHPINLAYEASTVNINDINMIDPYHYEKYGTVAINYNRDIAAFPLLQTMFRRMYGNDIYHSPTDMGVNMIGFCIDDMEAAERASKDEVIRRYYETLCYQKQGRVDGEAVRKINVLMEQLELKPTDRDVVTPALKESARSGKNAAAIKLHSGEIIVASASGTLTSASSELLLKTLQKLLSINSKIKILPENVIQKTIELKKDILGEKKIRLRIGELLVLLASSSLTNELCLHAVGALPQLYGCEAHITYMINAEEARIFRKLGINLTQEPII